MYPSTLARDLYIDVFRHCVWQVDKAEEGFHIAHMLTKA